MMAHAAPRDTRTRILDAAEHLLSEHGYRGTSVRAVTEHAGANLAAVGYHFGSKAQLLAAVARRAIEPITAAQREGLDRLEAQQPAPSVARLVEAFAGPMFEEVPAGIDDGARRARVVMSIITDPAEEMRSWSGPEEGLVRDRYLAAFARALPALSPGELRFRLRGTLAVVAVDRLGGVDRHGPTTPSDALRCWAIAFLTAAMSAPPTDAREQDTSAATPGP